jgi:hypothetical protein
LADSRSIGLGGRAIDVLLAPIEASRTVVSRDELLSCVWLIGDRTRAPPAVVWLCHQTEMLEHVHPCTAVLACKNL